MARGCGGSAGGTRRREEAGVRPGAAAAWCGGGARRASGRSGGPQPPLLRSQRLSRRFRISSDVNPMEQRREGEQPPQQQPWGRLLRLGAGDGEPHVLLRNREWTIGRRRGAGRGWGPGAPGWEGRGPGARGGGAGRAGAGGSPGRPRPLGGAHGALQVFQRNGLRCKSGHLFTYWWACHLSVLPADYVVLVTTS